MVGFDLLGIYSLTQLIMAIAVIIVSLGMGTAKIFVEMFKDRDIKKKNPGISFFIPPFLKVFLFLFLPLPCYLSSSSSQFLFFLLAVALLPPRYSSSSFLLSPKLLPPPPSPGP